MPKPNIGLVGDRDFLRTCKACLLQFRIKHIESIRTNFRKRVELLMIENSNSNENNLKRGGFRLKRVSQCSLLIAPT